MATIETIASRENQRLIRARKVRDGKDRERVFIEGRRLAEEALRSGLVIEEAFVAEEFGDPALVEKISKRAAAVSKLSARLFKSIADTEHPQGIALLARRPVADISLIESRLNAVALPVVVFLNKVNDPSNLGAVLRTAEAADAAGVIVSPNSADAFSPKASRGAMGANFRLPVIEELSLHDALEWARARRTTPVATTASASRAYTAMDLTKPHLVVFGSEAHGLDASEIERIGGAVQIPVENDVESLNLAVSAGIILFEAKRQCDAAG